MTDKTLNQRVSLAAQLDDDELECLICCCIIRRDVAIWNCPLCYTIFHLFCVKKWANSNAKKTDKRFWYCPTCNACNDRIPNSYTCFCGKVRDPPVHQSIIPHSCGDQCLKFRTRYNELCRHPCTERCHPGPCPPCQVIVDVTCMCTRNSRKQQCSIGFADWSCDQVCLKYLACGLHECIRTCHSGDCGTCERVLELVCGSHSTVRNAPCSECCTYVVKYSDGRLGYTCDQPCGKPLSCGIHSCERQCHMGPCAEPCPLSPELWDSCFCGKKTNREMQIKRSSCADPIPSCGSACGKLLKCQHPCQLTCHPGPCECKFSTTITCKCRFQRRITLECKDLDIPEKQKCNRKCGIRKNCLRHKCQNVCCELDEHICEMVCGRRLSCGLHTCPLPCHAGDCPSCKRASFDDVSCRCGRTVIQAPVPCGTRLPKCRHLCTRDHPCDHPVSHNCHEGETCPPCVFLTSKRCMCGNELINNVQCFIEEVSCGKQCGKRLPCGVHFCTLQCHQGQCWPVDQPCDKLCIKRRDICGHPCGSLCHGSSPCPNSICSATIISTCPCGRQQRLDICGVRNSYAQSSDVQLDSDGRPKVLQAADLESAVAYRLQCDAECDKQTKLTRMAAALNIDRTNPKRVSMPSASLGRCEYTDNLKKLAHTLGYDFTKATEAKLYSFVADTIERRCERNILRFKSAGWKKRQLVQQLAPFYGCSTYEEGVGTNSVNVVLTGQFGRCRYASNTLCSVVWCQADTQIPPPVNSKSTEVKKEQTTSAHSEACNDTHRSFTMRPASSDGLERRTFASIFATHDLPSGKNR